MQTQEKVKTAEKRMWTDPIPFGRAADTAVFYDIISRIAAEYPAVRVSSIGESIMGREIPVITLGEHRESRGILLTGGFSGTDLYTPAMLLRFVRDYAEYLSAGKRIYSVSLPYLYASRTIHVVPMLNPDGYAIRRVGVSDIPIADRLIRQNGGGDFSSWRYNARGVNLTENFVNREDKRTEREPETESLCRYIRMAQNGVIGKIEMAVELHADSSAIRYFSGEKTAPRSKTIARLLARMTGCRMDPGEGMREEGGSLTDYFLQTVGCPAFSCGCLDAGGEKCASVEEEYLRMYAAFREALFSAALLL